MPPDDGRRTLLIAEVAQAHDGSLGTALAYVDAAARAGAHAVKFQTHIAAAESTPHEPWRVRFSPQDETRYEYWRRMEFSEAQWRLLRQRAEERGLLFISSPFSVEAVDLLRRVGLDAWKIASGEVRNHDLIERIIESGLPVFMSTGMSGFEEIDAAANMLVDHGLSVTLMQCTSKYPTAPEEVGLNVLGELRERHPSCGIGLSDHSGTIYAGLAAAALGADTVEVHVCFSREGFGPDVPASITIGELAMLAEGLRFVDAALGHPVDKDALALDLSPMRRLFMKSVVAASDLPAGTVLSASDLRSKKPGTGIPGSELETLVGRRLRRAVEQDQLLSHADFDG